MVHSNGTLCESHCFRIERTGRKKSSARSADCRDDSATGEDAARRAMPTSGAATFRVRPSVRGVPWTAGDPDLLGATSENDGEHSVAGLPEMLSPGPETIGAGSSPVSVFGLCASGYTGKRADCT